MSAVLVFIAALFNSRLRANPFGLRVCPATISDRRAFAVTALQKCLRSWDCPYYFVIFYLRFIQQLQSCMLFIRLNVPKSIKHSARVPRKRPCVPPPRVFERRESQLTDAGAVTRNLGSNRLFRFHEKRGAAGKAVESF